MTVYIESSNVVPSGLSAALFGGSRGTTISPLDFARGDNYIIATVEGRQAELRQ
jgi:hypothetical protein